MDGASTNRTSTDHCGSRATGRYRNRRLCRIHAGLFHLRGPWVTSSRAIILLSIFAIAVPEFGHLDAEHFTIIAILGIVGLHGVSVLQERARPAHSNSALLDAGTTVAIYLGLLTSFIISYYLLQAMQYR